MGDKAHTNPTPGNDNNPFYVPKSSSGPKMNNFMNYTNS